MYTLGFQDSLLQWIVQRREGLEYVDFLTSELFDLSENQIVLDLLQGYKKKYKTLPKNATNLLEHFDRESKASKSKVQEEVYRQIGIACRKCYQPYTSDEQIIKESIIEYRQWREMVGIFKEYAPRINDGIEAFRECYTKIGGTLRLAEKANKEVQHRGGLMLAEWRKNQHTSFIEGCPIFLHGVNAMTSARGFYTPQLIILMGAPKSFKTGTALSIAIDLMITGLNVYYVDTENGINSIKARVLQGLAHSTRSDLRLSETQDDLEQIINKIRTTKSGGEFVVDFYPAHLKTTDDVKANLQYYKEEHGWEPDVIFWDNPDNMTCCDKSIKEKRLKIQHVYFDIINLQDEYQVWGIGISQVNKNAVNREVLTMKDFAEDFAKAMNCHAAFAICRTADEMINGIARIVPVVQREGVPAGTAECFIEIDAAHMKVTEINHEMAALKSKRFKRDENADIFGNVPEELDQEYIQSKRNQLQFAEQALNKEPETIKEKFLTEPDKNKRKPGIKTLSDDIDNLG